MFRLLTWFSVFVLLALALPRQGWLTAVCEPAMTRLSPEPARSGEPIQLAEPVNLDDDADLFRGDAVTDVGAATAALLVPGTPCFELSMPSTATRAPLWWSRAIQECGPPRA